MGDSEMWSIVYLEASQVELFVGMCLQSKAVVHGQHMSCRGTYCSSFDVYNSVLDAHTRNTNSCPRLNDEQYHLAYAVNIQHFLYKPTTHRVLHARLHAATEEVTGIHDVLVSTLGCASVRRNEVVYFGKKANAFICFLWNKLMKNNCYN